MKLKSFKELIGMSKEKLAEVLAPIRVRKLKSQAELEKAKLDDEIVRLEAEVQELCAKEDITFPAILDKLDRIALLERRRNQYNEVLGDLFPKEQE